MQTCETCRHWQAKPEGYRIPEYVGLCREVGSDETSGIAFTLCDDSNRAELLTGRAFGCVRHQPRDQAEL